MTLWYLSHPEVAIDPAVAVPEWGLSPVGRRRLARVASRAPWRDASRVVSSAETKAQEAAALIAAASGVAVEVRAETGEIDRSAAGFLPPDEFEGVADAFFARPTASVRGWERAVDAQARVVAALADLLGERGASDADVVVVGHGGVGTLWACHLAGTPIDRVWDQTGQGNVQAVDRSSGTVLHRWRPLEEVTGRVVPP